jgi:hypothetical protein
MPPRMSVGARVGPADPWHGRSGRFRKVLLGARRRCRRQARSL